MNDCPSGSILLEGVSKIFHTPAGDFIALRHIDVTFACGQFVAVVGKSGSGKSTLANMITGIDHPSQGRVVVDGVEVHTLDESARSRWRGRTLGIVFQFFQLLPTLTLLENVVLPMDLARLWTPPEREARAAELLARVGLVGLDDKLPAEVAGGQQQSAAIARALANDPPILIADEPTGNLDSRAADAVFDLFRALTDEGKTVVMVTHDPGLAARADRRLLISDGEIIDESLAHH
jgi:putative ABC transport system ATP-binding protein